MAVSQTQLILSLFPGVGLLDRAFEEEGFCVVRGPDLLWGGDVRKFHPPPGVFGGVIGGPPCQDFSGLRRCPPTGYGEEMLLEFLRVVEEACPQWWLLENVAQVPTVTAPDYVTQRIDLDNAWFTGATSRRLRHIQFGSLSGRLLDIERKEVKLKAGAATANDARPLRDVIQLQGLPEDFDLPGFTIAAKKRAIGNGVPLPMGRALARSVTSILSKPPPIVQAEMFEPVPSRPDVCLCGCGRRVTGRKQYFDYACRKRAQRKRDLAAAEKKNRR